MVFDHNIVEPFMLFRWYNLRRERVEIKNRQAGIVEIPAWLVTFVLSSVHQQPRHKWHGHSNHQ
jgi:hypothetical protein